MVRLIQYFTLTFVLLVAHSVFAKPYVPASADELVGVFSIPEEIKKINQFRNQLEMNKNDYQTLDKILRLYMQLGREKSDPRYFGYAEAIITAYLDNEDLPEYIMIHWADILQHRHDFDKSLLILNSRVSKNSSNSQVYLMRAIIHISRGEYALALDNCKALLSRASHLLSVSCVTQVKSLSGQLQASFELLRKTYSRSENNDLQEKLWAVSLLGDMAMRAGNNSIAEFYYLQGLKLNNKDYYILANYADLLLKQKQYSQVIRLLSDFTYVDSLVLRLLQAGNYVDFGDAVKYVSRLESVYRLNEQRGERAHLRDQAKFYTDVKGDYKKAYQLAKLNWTLQKEPADTRLLLRLAIKTRDIKQENIVTDWVISNSIEDAELSRLLNRVKEI